MTSRPITDRAEVSIDFPEKFYHGTFTRESRYDVSVDAEGLHIHLTREGEQKRHIAFHLHYLLLADILQAAAEAVKDKGSMQDYQRQHLLDAAENLLKALEGR